MMSIVITDRTAQIIERLESLVLEADSELIIFKSKPFGETRILFDEFKPDVVLLDMEIRANRAFGLLKHIKELHNKTIVFALSTFATRKIREQSEKLGAYYFLDTYHEFGKIPAIIKKICEARNYMGETIQKIKTIGDAEIQTERLLGTYLVWPAQKLNATVTGGNPQF